MSTLKSFRGEGIHLVEDRPAPNRRRTAAALLAVFVAVGVIVGLAQAKLLPTFSADDAGSLPVDPSILPGN